MKRRSGTSAALRATAFALVSCSRSALDVADFVAAPAPTESGTPPGDDNRDAAGPLVDAPAEGEPEAAPEPTDAFPESTPDVRVDHGALMFASGSEWASYSGVPSSGSAPTDALGTSLGPAATVCLNQALPGNCPPGAVLYGYGGNSQAWGGGQSLTAAYWIWRADVAVQAPAALALAVFQRAFTAGSGATGTIQISADDSATVFVNSVQVGAVGSVVDITAASKAQGFPTSVDLSGALRAGNNTITIVAQNGPYGCGSGPCPYSQDPAGVVFEGTIRW